jgi:hypothetical protein
MAEHKADSAEGCVHVLEHCPRLGSNGSILLVYLEHSIHGAQVKHDSSPYRPCSAHETGAAAELDERQIVLRTKTHTRADIFRSLRPHDGNWDNGPRERIG